MQVRDDLGPDQGCRNEGRVGGMCSRAVQSWEAGGLGGWLDRRMRQKTVVLRPPTCHGAQGPVFQRD